LAGYLSSAEAVKTEPGRKTHGHGATRLADVGARAFSAAVARGGTTFEGDARNARARFYVLRATSDKRARLNHLLDELDDAAAQSSDHGDEILLTILLSPAPSKGLEASRPKGAG
jgi:hypothetical protein